MMKKILMGLTFLIAFACESDESEFPQEREGQVEANGMRIAYESFGSNNAETILLIAGTNAQLTLWPLEFCHQLVKRGYRVIRFDNRDIGLSKKLDAAGLPDWEAITKALEVHKTPPLPYTLDDMATDAVDLLTVLGIQKAHIVGASMGGMIAQRVAYNHPKRTLSLASIMAGGGSRNFPLIANPAEMAKIPPPGEPSDTAAYIQREIQVARILSGPVYPPDTVKLLEQIKADVKRAYDPAGARRQEAASLAGFYAGRQDELEIVKVPTLVIHGTEDPVVVVGAGQDVADHIPDAKFKLINGMGHYISGALINDLADLIAENASKVRKK